MTRKLTTEEFKSIGQPKEWGVLPVRPMGATIRMTKDRRILIRNTVEVCNSFNMNKIDLNQRSVIQKKGIFIQMRMRDLKLQNLLKHAKFQTEKKDG